MQAFYDRIYILPRAKQRNDNTPYSLRYIFSTFYDTIIYSF